MTPFLLLILCSVFSPVERSPVIGAVRVISTPASRLAIYTHTAPRIEAKLQLPASADTVRAGETFIANLPDSLAGWAVDHYRGIALPGRSWLLERSFFWKTTEQDRGDHDIWFRAILDDERVDSLSVRVTVE